MTTPMSATPPMTPVPRMREGDQPDRLDGDRISYVRNRCWMSQNGILRPWERNVEKSIRMLAGQQWTQYNTMLGRWINTTEWLTEDERRWRQRPVLNILLQWFMLTHARLTENPPIIGFLPGPDMTDAELAETADIIYKVLWRETGMPDVIDRLYTWLIPAGTAYLETRVDLQAGPLVPWVGGANVPHADATGALLYGPDGRPVTTEVPEGVPFDAQGKPLAVIGPEGLQVTGEPHAAPRGALVVDVLNPLQVRGEWGPTPWHLKRYHVKRSFLSEEDVYDQWGVEVPGTITAGSMLEDSGSLERLLFGAGYFGAADSAPGSQSRAAPTAKLVDVTTYWERPGRMSPRGPGNPGGRLLVVTPTKVLYDGPRPAEFLYTSPIRRFEFVRLPGRPEGSSPQESMNGPQESLNKGMQQQLEHRALVTNPKAIIDLGSGLGSVKITNRPGENLKVNRRPGVPPFEYVSPPQLSQDVYMTQRGLLEMLQQLGWMNGATRGEPPGKDPSGELVKELRFDADRFTGPTQRRTVEEIARLYEDWRAILPVIWDQQTVLDYAGDDNIARTITVLPDMFKPGKFNIVADAESMLPEGRGERQARVWTMYTAGIFGMPGTPQAIKQFLDLANFPALSRAARPGGTDRRTAEQENGELLQGAPWQAIPVYDWYDQSMHLMVHEEFMKRPEFKRLDPTVQQNFAMHREVHRQTAMRLMMEQAQVEAEMNSILQPPEEEEGPGGSAKKGKEDPDRKKKRPAGSENAADHAPSGASANRRDANSAPVAT